MPTIAEYFKWMHEHPPAPFNIDARPELGEAVSTQYKLYCERYPNATKEERKQFYAATRDGLRDKYPTHAELASATLDKEN